jgi:hypothetical protein
MNLRNNQVNVAGSYNKSLDGTGATYFSIGFTGGVAQRSIAFKASWDRQFDGLQYDPTLPTGESGAPDDSYSYFDCAAGVAITSTANERFRLNAGLVAHHLNRPRIDFLGGTDRMYIKFGAHFAGQLALGQNPRTWLLPQLQIIQQGPARLVNIGLGLKYRLSEHSHYTDYRSQKSLSAGVMYRLADAGSAYVRVDIGAVGVAFNYDLNISKLTTASNGMGALEFMVIYTGIYRSKNLRLTQPSFF